VKSLFVGVAVAATFTTAPAHAVVQSGNSWLQLCTSKQAPSQDRCLAYTRGLADGLTTASGIMDVQGAKNSWLVCMPKGVTTQQLVDVGVKYMRDNPAERHEWAAPLLTIAFSEAWPCKPADESAAPLKKNGRRFQDRFTY